jgi:hypothetical protein
MPHRRPQRMTRRIPRSGPPSPTPTTPTCPARPSVHGSSACSGPSSSLALTSSSSSAIPLSPSPACVCSLPRRHAPVLTSYLPQIVAQLISFPLMRLWARFVPQVKIFGVSLNPGPFTIKEHVIITIMANVGSGSAYAVRTFSLTCGVLTSNFGPSLLRRTSSLSSVSFTTRTQPLVTHGCSSCLLSS